MSDFAFKPPVGRPTKEGLRHELHGHNAYVSGMKHEEMIDVIKKAPDSEFFPKSDRARQVTEGYMKAANLRQEPNPYAQKRPS